MQLINDPRVMSSVQTPVEMNKMYTFGSKEEKKIDCELTKVDGQVDVLASEHLGTWVLGPMAKTSGANELRSSVSGDGAHLPSWRCAL